MVMFPPQRKTADGLLQHQTTVADIARRKDETSHALQGPRN